MSDTLSNREKEVLKYIVNNFVKFALPIGSREISRQTDLNLSSATIRNVMSDLEELELLKTPHTSAGRVPTDKGYRYFVDALMNQESLNEIEKNRLRNQIEEQRTLKAENEEIFFETSKILGKISHQLAVVTQPFLNSGVFERLEIVCLTSSKILVILNIKSGIVRTVMMEIDTEITKSKLDKLTSFLNERLAGLTLKQIRETFADRITDYRYEEPELVQMFINSIDKLYADEEKGSGIYVAGTGEVIMQPEFDDPQSFKNIIELAEDKNFVVHIFQNANLRDDEVSITIGSENDDEKLKNYSLMCASYKLGGIQGNIGIIGPKRMNYSKMVSLIQYTSKLISELKF